MELESSRSLSRPFLSDAYPIIFRVFSLPGPLPLWFHRFIYWHRETKWMVRVEVFLIECENFMLGYLVVVVLKKNGLPEG